MSKASVARAIEKLAKFKKGDEVFWIDYNGDIRQVRIVRVSSWDARHGFEYTLSIGVGLSAREGWLFRKRESALAALKRRKK